MTSNQFNKEYSRINDRINYLMCKYSEKEIMELLNTIVSDLECVVNCKESNCFSDIDSKEVKTAKRIV